MQEHVITDSCIEKFDNNIYIWLIFSLECYTIFINKFYQCPFFDLGGVRSYLATLSPKLFQNLGNSNFWLKLHDIRHCLSLEYNRLMVSAAVPRTTRTSRQFMTRAKSSQLNSNHATSATFPASTDSPFAMWYHQFKQFTRKASVRAWMRKNISEISVSYLMVLYTVFLNFTSVIFLIAPVNVFSSLYW